MMNWLDRHLVADWRESWRYSSVQLAAVASAVGGVVAASPDLLLQLAHFLPEGPWRWVVVTLVVLVMFVLPTIARLWNQEAGDDDAAA